MIYDAEWHRQFVDQLGFNIRSQRSRVGISQRELGMRASLDRTLISMHERGERVPRADTLVRIAGSLDIRPGVLLDGLQWLPEVAEEIHS